MGFEPTTSGLQDQHPTLRPLRHSRLVGSLANNVRRCWLTSMTSGGQFHNYTGLITHNQDFTQLLKPHVLLFTFHTSGMMCDSAILRICCIVPVPHLNWVYFVTS